MLKSILMCAAGASVLAAGAAQAQAGGEDDAVLAEVVVTAQRRTESAQTLGASVTVLSGAELEKKHVEDLRDLQNATPSLTVNDSGILTFANIRGIGLNLSAPTVVSGVATYRDGLFAPSPLFLNEGLFDIASIEVLRGPQGTFVGQNSTGGAIFQTSRSPELGDGPRGFAEAEAGNYNRTKFQGAINVPVSETFALRLAALRDDRDSWYKNLGPGPTPGDVHQSSARLGLLWKPTDAFQSLLKVEYNRGRSDGYPQQPIAGTMFAPRDPAGRFTLNYDRTDIQRHERSIRSSLEVRYRLGNGVTLRSVSGYQYGDQHFINDDDATAANDAYEDQAIVDRVYSQEINIISPEAGPLTWVVGGSYVRQTARLDLNLYSERFPFAAIFPRQDIHIYTLVPKISEGLFAQIKHQLTGRLAVEVGGRFSHDEQTQRGILGLFPAPPLPGAIDASSPRFKDDNLTGKLAVNFQADDNNFLYAFVANGFKSGGVNLPAGTFDSEKVVDYEAGWKSTLANGHARIQVDGFYMDYRKLQLNVFNPFSGGTAVANVGKSDIYGVEASVQSRFGGLSIDASASYVKSKLGALTLIDDRSAPGGSNAALGPQCPAGVQPNPPTCFDYAPYSVSVTGRRNPYSPKVTFSAGVEYVFDLPNGATITPRLDTSYFGSQTVLVFEDPARDILKSRQLWNAQVAYAQGDWRLTGFVTNLTDRAYVSGRTGDNEFYGAPREYGLRLSRQF